MIEELIRKYFDEGTSDKEKKEIYQYFEDNPLKFKEYFSEDEWDSFLSERKSASADEQRTTIKLSSFQKNTKRHYKRIPLIAVILTSCVLMLSFFIYHTVNKQYNAENKNVALNVRSEVDTKPKIVVLENSSGAIKNIILPDGSQVQLFKGSEISYLEKFDSSKRNVFLTGTAIFKVAKDSKRPFTVFCKEVATTALGTEFKISSAKEKISVNLIEGKIMVRSTKKDTRLTNKMYYLLAGSTILFNRSENKFQEETKPDVPLNTSASEKYKQFDDKNLTEVLSYLSGKYHVKIVYSETTMAQIRFVGTIYDKESVESVLGNIALMSNMKLHVDSSSSGRTFILE